METLSPELVLVDERLAAVARQALPATSAPGRRQTIRTPVLRVAAPPNGSESRFRRARLHVIALSALVLAVPAASLDARTTPQPAPASDTGRSTLPARSKHAPAEGGLVRWQPVRGADLYNVIIHDGARRVDLWPEANEIRLGPSSDPVQDLEPGTYSWFVYPGFSRGERMKYGPLLAHGTVSVPRRPSA